MALSTVTALSLATAVDLGAPTVEAAPDPRAPLVAIDAGHGAGDYGASSVTGGKRIVEKDLTLQVSLKLSDSLRAAGYRTLLTRPDDSWVNKGVDRNADAKMDLADELQARVDLANEAGAAVFLSIHFNGSTDRTLRGTEVYYSPARPFAAENRRLAEAVLKATAASLSAADIASAPRGVKRDVALGGGSLFVLGPTGGRIARASNMPGALVEGLFISNPDDAALLASPGTIDALVRGYADGLAAFLGPPPKPLPKSGQIIGPYGAFLRPSPLVATVPIATIPTGASVDIAEPATGDEVGDRADWWRVDWKGQAGYVFAGLVQPAAVTPPTTPPRGTPTRPAVTVRNDDGRAARLRAEPTRETAILARAAPGETLEVIDQTDDGEAVDGKSTRWLKVRRADQTLGWVWALLVSGPR